MMSSTTSALFLAYISHLPKKRGNRNIKRIQEQLQTLQTEANAHLQILREGTADILPAWEVLNGTVSHPYISVLHIVGEYPSEEKLYINMARGKRQMLSFDQLYFERLSGLKLVILEAGFSLDIAEQWVFSGHAAVLLLDESIDREAFRTTFYSALMSGRTLEESLHYTAQLLETYIPRHEIPSDPYEYWELKSSRKEGTFHSWGLLYLSSERSLMDWQWVAPAPIPELRQERMQEPENIQGPGTLPQLRGSGGTYMEARQREIEAMHPTLFQPEVSLMLESGETVKAEESTPAAELVAPPTHIPVEEEAHPLVEEKPLDIQAEEKVRSEESLHDSDPSQSLDEEISPENAEEIQEQEQEEEEIYSEEEWPEPDAETVEEDAIPGIVTERIESDPGVLDLEADFPPIYIPEPIYLEFAEVKMEESTPKVEEVIPRPTMRSIIQDPTDRPLETALSDSIRERELMIHQNPQNTSRHVADPQPNPPHQNVSWLAGVWGVGVSMFIALSLLLFVGQDPEMELAGTPNLLETFQQTNKYNVLILPFTLHPDCFVEGKTKEEEIKNWLNTLQESSELGLHVAFANGVACPQNAEEAKRIGEVYGAHLVLWGNYGSPSWDSTAFNLNYVALDNILIKDPATEVQYGGRSFLDIYDLKEGNFSGSLADIHHWILATAYLRNEDYQAAYSNLSLIESKRQQGYALYHRMLAKCYQGMGYFKDCIKEYTEAIRLNPQDPNSYHQRGRVFAALNLKEKALSDYEYALTINPHHREALDQREQLWLELDAVEINLNTVNPQKGLSDGDWKEVELAIKTGLQAP
ncbi:MAG: tetratricopeptide repeat protein [Bacteroidota bacterium]